MYFSYIAFVEKTAYYVDRHITIKNLYWNGRPVTDWSEFELDWKKIYREHPVDLYR